MLNDISRALETREERARNTGVKPTCNQAWLWPLLRRRHRRDAASNDEGNGDGLEPATAPAGPRGDRDRRPQTVRAVLGLRRRPVSAFRAVRAGGGMGADEEAIEWFGDGVRGVIMFLVVFF